MKKTSAYLLVTLLLTVGLMFLARSGVGGLPFERSWTASGSLGGDEAMAWTQTYEFAGGAYSMTGYPPIASSGSYSLVMRQNDGYQDDYILLVTPEQGDPEAGDPYLMELSLHNDGSMVMSSYSSYSGVTFY